MVGALLLQRPNLIPPSLTFCTRCAWYDYAEEFPEVVLYEKKTTEQVENLQKESTRQKKATWNRRKHGQN